MNWKLPAESLEAFIRGMTPWPGAFSFHEKKRLKFFKAKAIVINTEASPGTVIKSFPDELWISTGKGVLSIMELQGESGKRLLIKDFLRGYKLPPGSQLH